jgi:hypothetical protein
MDIPKKKPVIGSRDHAARPTAGPGSSRSQRSQPLKNAKPVPTSGRDRTLSAQKATAGAKPTQMKKSAAVQVTPTSNPKTQSHSQATSGRGGTNHRYPDPRTTSNPGNMNYGAQPYRASTLNFGRSQLTEMSNLSIQPTQERRTLRLISLKPVQYPNLTPTFYHWGILLMHTTGPVNKGDLYHSRRANRENPNAPQLAQQAHSLQPCRGCIPSVSGAGSGYEIHRNYNPYESTRQTVHMNTSVVLNHIIAEDLDRICRMVNTTYPYGATYNNCQNFSIRVLRQMVFEGILSMQQFDDTRANFYNPLTAAWSLIRNHSSDLRLGHH